MKNLWIIYAGIANIVDGVLRIGSLGFWESPGYGQRASWAYARWEYRRNK